MATALATVAESLTPIVHHFAGGNVPISFRFWDGSEIASPSAAVTVDIASPRVLRRLLWDPNEIGLARAYVSGELDVRGDLYTALGIRSIGGGRPGRSSARLGWRDRSALLRVALRSGALGPRLPAPPEEVRLRGARHSRARDASAVSHHYDISNEFYRLVLGDTMTYSCAYFERPDAGLDEAQEAKYDLVCRKLALAPGMRLLDVGCGWGGMTVHAARHYGVSAVGITVSARQAELATERVAAAGLSGAIDIRLQDYRDIEDGPFDAISSIGMFEHVGSARLRAYFSATRRLLRPEGRMLNHAISRPASSAERQPAIGDDTFIGRYVFPDGELLEVGEVVTAMQAAALEVRDVESLREHYAITLRAWVSNLEANWQQAVELVGPGRARVWRLYMAASAVGFEVNRTSLHQVLGVRTADDGRSGVPMTRAELLAPEHVGREEGAARR